MSDIFREVEEEVRRERLEKLWKQYGDYIMAGAAVLAIGVAAFLLWQRYELNRTREASAQYDAAVQLASTDPAAAATKFESLSKTAPSGYATLAKFSEADSLLATGERDKALAIYQSLGSGDDLIGAAARVRAAWSIVEFAPRATVGGLVGSLAGQDSPWRFVSREVLAYADYRTGESAKAAREYQSLVSDPQTPESLRNRARAMAALIKAGGERDYGTVPPPPTSTPKVLPHNP